MARRRNITLELRRVELNLAGVENGEAHLKFLGDGFVELAIAKYFLYDSHS